MSGVTKKLSSSQIIILGFALVILAGAVLLSLPVAASSGQRVPFSEALFTSTSAVCVTGLVVHDTASYWSSFGQGIILMLIQIGGMGVMTVAVIISMVLRRRIGLKERSLMQESISANHVGGIVRLTGFIIRMTLIFEAVGAAAMAPVFCREFGLGKGIWYAIFHSISAFCNAGFDLMGVREQYSSLTAFAGSPLINITVMLLIIIGGIGFLTWNDISTNKLNYRRYRMQTKVILLTTVCLILLPAVYFFFLEFKTLPFGERVFQSLFQSVTTRTAGFNTADLGHLSECGLGLMIILMLIGGSPGSTAGGMKTTTFAVLFATALSVFRRRSYARLFGRRIADDTVRHMATILFMYISLFLTGGFIISRVESLPLLKCLFETASAVGTVGLTTGITFQLGEISRGILIFLMYIGRVGGLTLIFSAVTGDPPGAARLPEEKVTVG